VLGTGDDKDLDRKALARVERVLLQAAPDIAAFADIYR
jgi:hypothetical protein